MTLRIRGTARFRASTLQALQTICPCFLYSLSDDGEVLLQSPQDHASFCRCYCAHLAGCNLMADLTSDANTVTIQRGRRGLYDPRRRRVRWNPRAQPRTRTTNGRQRTPPDIVLGHELIHAHHHNSGTLAQGRTNGILNEEINTVRGENQLRADKTPPVPQRTHYGRRRVPNPGTHDLDTTDRYDCNCGAPRPEPRIEEEAHVTPDQLSIRLQKMAGQAPTDLGAEMAEALALRDIAATGEAFERTMDSATAAPRAIIFETISVADESHIYFAITQDAKTARLITNAVLEQVDGLWDIDQRDSPKTHALPLSDDTAKRLDRAFGTQIKDRIGGDDDVLDGTFDILTMLEEGKPRIAALYGADWGGFDEDAAPPDNRADAGTWKAMEEVRALILHLWDQR
ncbi:M91 family zinc metallopeptidase [uncultured Tateyamaria sp.]|uniref:M91 family zinc metallopeptidase n=1 Tax=uncultured Tateyamaria sp. TaxID=455651 RepID=UPI00261F3860|nr:M91 family zinc metallopeptidase [uncultured Tateyamaria sp.]